MNTHDPSHKKIFEAIKSGDIKMRPKWHFVVGGFLAGLGALIVFFVSVFVISFIIFAIYRTGIGFALPFGFLGIKIFVGSLPWILIVAVVLFMFVLEAIIKRYAFSYRQPIFYSVTGLFIIVVVGGIVVAQTSIHTDFLREARHDRLPVAGSIYRMYGLPHFSNIHRGTINQFDENGFIMGDYDNNQSVGVLVTPETRFPFGTNFSIGDTVIVIGDQDPYFSTTSTSSVYVIDAVGVSKVDSDGDTN